MDSTLHLYYLACSWEVPPATKLTDKVADKSPAKDGDRSTAVETFASAARKLPHLDFANINNLDLSKIKEWVQASGIPGGEMIMKQLLPGDGNDLKHVDLVTLISEAPQVVPFVKTLLGGWKDSDQKKEVGNWLSGLEKAVVVAKREHPTSFQEEADRDGEEEGTEQSFLEEGEGATESEQEDSVSVDGDSPKKDPAEDGDSPKKDPAGLPHVDLEDLNDVDLTVCGEDMNHIYLWNRGEWNSWTTGCTGH